MMMQKSPNLSFHGREDPAPTLPNGPCQCISPFHIPWFPTSPTFILRGASYLLCYFSIWGMLEEGGRKSLRGGVLINQLPCGSVNGVTLNQENL